MLFAVPATLTVTLPPSVTLPAEAMVDFADGATGEVLIPVTTTVSGSTATSEIRFFGSPGAPGLRMNPEDWDTTSVELRAMLLPRLVETLTARYHELVASRRYEDAIATGMGLAALVQRQEDPNYAAAVGTLLTEMRATACGRLEEEVSQLEIFGNARCPWEARKNVEAVMIWAKLTQHLDGVGGPCAVLDSGAYYDEVQAELTHATTIAETNPVAFRACECEIPASEGSPPTGCGRSTPDEDSLLASRVEGVGYNTQSMTRLAVLDEAAVVGTFDSEFRGPYSEDVHKRAWDLCHDQGDQWALHALSEEVADGAVLLDDVKYCGSQLGLTAKDADGEVIGTANAGGSGPGVFAAAASTGAIEGGSLVLSGPIRAFKCHEEPPRFEEDQLLVKRVAASGTTQVASRIALDGYLVQPSDNVVLLVDSLTSGLEGAPLVLEVWRSSPSCSGTYGPSEVKLFTVTFEVEPAEEEDDPALRIGKYTEVSHIVSSWQDSPAQATWKKVSWEITAANSFIYRCTNLGNQQSCGVLVYGGTSTATQIVWDGSSYAWPQPATTTTEDCYIPNPDPDMAGEWTTVSTSSSISFSGQVTLAQDGSATMVQTWETHHYKTCPGHPGDAWTREVFTGTKPAPP